MLPQKRPGRNQREPAQEILEISAGDHQPCLGLSTTKSKGVESLGYRFEMSDNLPATGVWLKSYHESSGQAPIIIVLNDKGELRVEDVETRVNRGEQVLALDVLFTGDSATA